MPLKWEFPGGKIHAGESPEECLKRERSIPFVCSLVTKEITLHEHKAVKWLLPDELLSLDWAEADIPIIKGYLEGIEGGAAK